MTQRAPFSSAVVIDEARKRSGLTSFGETDFLDALEAYLAGLNEQLPLFSERGKGALFEEVVGALQSRLRLENYIAQNPGVLCERVSRPIFITGLYRSGTTRMQNLLSADPRLIHLQSWQTTKPVPMDGDASGENDPRIALSQQGLDMLKQMAPHASQAHPLRATDPSEEFPLMTPSFRAQDAKQVGSGFKHWLKAQDNAPMYRDLRRALQALQFQFKRPGVSEQRFVLKAPIHLGNLDLLTRVFPDAKVIFTHRDPFPAIHSFTMVRESLRGVYCDHIDPEMMGSEILEQAASALDRFVAVRASTPGGAFFDLSFQDIVTGLAERLDDIYRFIDAPLPEDVRATLRRTDGERDRHKSRASHRDPAHYGLTRERIDGRTRDYLAWARDMIGGRL
jgi:hypothetical protein